MQILNILNRILDPSREMKFKVKSCDVLQEISSFLLYHLPFFTSPFSLLLFIFQFYDGPVNGSKRVDAKENIEPAQNVDESGVSRSTKRFSKLVITLKLFLSQYTLPIIRYSMYGVPFKLIYCSYMKCKDILVKGP